jgi:hypothetical protein
MRKRPELKEQLEDFDPVKQRSWYHQFDPHTHVPNLQPVSLAEKPQVKRSESVSDFMKRNRSTQKEESLTKKCFSSAAFANTLAQKQIEHTPTFPKPEDKSSNFSAVPMDLFARIKAKEERDKTERKLREAQAEQDTTLILKEQMLKMTEIVKAVFSRHASKAMYIDKLMEQLEDNQRGRFDNPIETKTMIKQLHEASPNFIKILKIPSKGVIVTLKDYSKKLVRRDIEAYVQKQKDQ